MLRVLRHRRLGRARGCGVQRAPGHGRGLCLLAPDSGRHRGERRDRRSRRPAPGDPGRVRKECGSGPGFTGPVDRGKTTGASNAPDRPPGSAGLTTDAVASSDPVPLRPARPRPLPPLLPLRPRRGGAGHPRKGSIAPGARPWASVTPAGASPGALPAPDRYGRHDGASARREIPRVPPGPARDRNGQAGAGHAGVDASFPRGVPVVFAAVGRAMVPDGHDPVSRFQEHAFPRVQLVGRGGQQSRAVPAGRLRLGRRALDLGRPRGRVLSPPTRGPACHRVHRAGEARRAHPPPKLPAVAASLASACFEVRQIRVERARSGGLVAGGGTVGLQPAVGPPPRSCPGPARSRAPTSRSRAAAAISRSGPAAGHAASPAADERPLAFILRGLGLRRHFLGRGACPVRDGACGSTHGTAAAVGGPLQRVAEVAQQVPPVRHLLRFRRALARPPRGRRRGRARPLRRPGGRAARTRPPRLRSGDGSITCPRSRSRTMVPWR